MTSNGFDYESISQNILKSIHSACSTQDIGELITICKPIIDGGDAEFKLFVDTAFKDILQELIRLKPPCDPELYSSLLNLSIEAARQEICSRNLIIMLLTDLFDCSSLEQCENLFELVEKKVDILKEDVFFKSLKNQMLRSCNDLLRRLSKSQNTVFCGRILVFLARFFPFFEQSGLNLMSDFNQDNVTSISIQGEGVLSESIQNHSESSNLEEGEMSNTDTQLQVDYNLYRKFWQLQDTFRHPITCYNKSSFKQFKLFATDVLTAFSNFKLDSSQGSSMQGLGKEHVYFAKYLTNQKLLELQFSDSCFRRCILVQFLILFQYLNATVRFKQEQHVLSEENSVWVTETTSKIHKLIEEAPPNGKDMLRCVEHILKREEYWNSWKNSQCPTLKPVNEPARQDLKNVPRKRKLGEEVAASLNANKMIVGNADLTKLWNLCPNNWEACKSKERIFSPSVDSYFCNIIHMSDSQKKRKIESDSSFNWRALRLLSQKSSHFFTPSNQMVLGLSNYLESQVDKLSRDFAAGSARASPIIDIDDEDSEPDEKSDDELLKHVDTSIETATTLNSNGDESNDSPNGVPGLLTASMIVEIGDKLDKDWKKLAPMLKMKEDEIEFFESQYSDTQEQARKMLTIWKERSSTGDATATKLQEAIDEAGISITISNPV